MEPSRVVLARLREIITSFAARNADAHPTDLRMVETNTTAWEVLSGVRDNSPPIPVYLVIASGDFVGMKAPPRVPAPRGTTLYMLLDRRPDFACHAWGLANSSVDLEKLGPLTRL